MKNNNQSCNDCANYVDEDYFPCNVCNGIVNYFSVEKTVPVTNLKIKTILVRIRLYKFKGTVYVRLKSRYLGKIIRIILH